MPAGRGTTQRSREQRALEPGEGGGARWFRREAVGFGRAGSRTRRGEGSVCPWDSGLRLQREGGVVPDWPWSSRKEAGQRRQGTEHWSGQGPPYRGPGFGLPKPTSLSPPCHSLSAAGRGGCEVSWGPQACKVADVWQAPPQGWTPCAWAGQRSVFLPVLGQPGPGEGAGRGRKDG